MTTMTITDDGDMGVDRITCEVVRHQFLMLYIAIFSLEKVHLQPDRGATNACAPVTDTDGCIVFPHGGCRFPEDHVEMNPWVSFFWCFRSRVVKSRHWVMSIMRIPASNSFPATSQQLLREEPHLFIRTRCTRSSCPCELGQSWITLAKLATKFGFEYGGNQCR